MIYVDEIRNYPHCRLPYKRWCHMATDGAIEELHLFAEKLGLKRRWFRSEQRTPTMTSFHRSEPKRFAWVPKRSR